MGRPKVFLIVDDDLDDIDFFRKAVNFIDGTNQCLVANNGEDALLQLRNKNIPIPDLIFLDLNMPRMNGRACLSELKIDEELKHIPVIIFSTSSHIKDVEETKELGAYSFITKPYQFKKLCVEIKSVLQKLYGV